MAVIVIFSYSDDRVEGAGFFRHVLGSLKGNLRIATAFLVAIGTIWFRPVY